MLYPESPNVEFGRDLWRSSCPTSLLKQGNQKLVAQGQVQEGFEYLQRGRLHNLHGQPVPGLSHLPSKKVFADGQVTPPVFQFVPIMPTHITQKRIHV